MKTFGDARVSTREQHAHVIGEEVAIIYAKNI